MSEPEGFIPRHGNCRELLSYQKVEVDSLSQLSSRPANRRLEKDFLKDGGLRERLTRARLASRGNQH